MTALANVPWDPQANEDLKTFTLRDSDIKAAAQLLRVLVDDELNLGQKVTSLPQNPLLPGCERADLIESARQAYVNRRRRARIFSDVMFGEASWDMLLALYVTDHSGSRHTVSGLAALSGAPSTTAIRWMDFLETKEALIRRKPSPTDRRIYMVELTDKAREAMDAYFSQVVAEGRSKEPHFAGSNTL